MPSPGLTSPSYYSAQSPQRSRNPSPRRSPVCSSALLSDPQNLRQRSRSPSPKRLPVCSSMHLEGLGSVQDKDLKLIATLARKRELDDEREWLTQQFHKLWEEERKQRKLAEAEQNECYHHFLNTKRREEQKELEDRRVRTLLELGMRRRNLVNYILYKDQRSSDVLAQQSGKKVTEMIDRSLTEEARAQMAAERRLEQDRVEHLRKLEELEIAQQRLDNALRRKEGILRDNARLTAINNVLSEWEAKKIREESKAMEAAKREEYVARIAINDSRAYRMALAKDSRMKQAKKMAAFTAQIRDAIRNGR